jgi:hypothetical protein
MADALNAIHETDQYVVVARDPQGLGHGLQVHGGPYSESEALEAADSLRRGYDDPVAGLSDVEIFVAPYYQDWIE